MLEFLKDKGSQRKLRLFAVACCRRMWQWFWFDECKMAVLIAEEFADGLRSESELAIACATAESHADDLAEVPEWAAVQASWPDIRETAMECAITSWVFYPIEGFVMKNPIDFPPFCDVKSAEEELKQIDVIRDIFANPFHPVAIDPSWQTPAVTGLAQSIYDQRRFEDMPLLADALEEAGCTNDEILEHCRGPGEHVRGCWVVDLVLGKE